VIDRPRSPGEIEVVPRLAGLLAELRQRAGVTTPTELALERVREVESAIGLHLGDDLLALLAADLPRLRERYRMTLGMIIGHTGALRDRRARGDLIGVGQLSRDLFLCLDKHAPASRHTRLLRYDAGDRTASEVDLIDWLAGEAAAVRGDAPPPTDLPVERYRLAHAVPESTAVGRRVRHPRFGEGRALREIGSGPTAKVQVDFPGIGLKLLQARFLEFLD
jgi:hypothetical protein